MLGEQKNFMPDIIMAVCDLGTICRQDRKWGPDLVSQLLYALLTSNFVIYIRVTKELHPWHHHSGYVTWVQFTDKSQIWYLKF